VLGFLEASGDVLSINKPPPLYKALTVTVIRDGREKTCSTLASCDRWQAACLKTMKCSGTRSHYSHIMANSLSKDPSSTNSEKLSGESRSHRLISSVTLSFWVRAAAEPSRPSTSETPRKSEGPPMFCFLRGELSRVGSRTVLLALRSHCRG
jgi:hypothetical protein